MHESTLYVNVYTTTCKHYLCSNLKQLSTSHGVPPPLLEEPSEGAPPPVVLEKIVPPEPSSETSSEVAKRLRESVRTEEYKNQYRSLLSVKPSSGATQSRYGT